MKLFIFAIIVTVVFGQECPPPPPPIECAEGEIPCFGGEDSNHCPWGDYCIPISHDHGDGIQCAGICAAMCEPGDLYCDNGMDENGCWMGNYCLQEGNVNYCSLSLFLFSYTELNNSYKDDFLTCLIHFLPYIYIL